MHLGVMQMKYTLIALSLFITVDALGVECFIVNTHTNPAKVSCVLAGKKMDLYVSKNSMFPMYHNKDLTNGKTQNIEGLSEYTNLYFDKNMKEIANGCRYAGDHQILKYKHIDIRVCATSVKCVTQGITHDQIAICPSKTDTCPRVQECMEDSSLAIRDVPKIEKKKKIENTKGSKGKAH